MNICGVDLSGGVATLALLEIGNSGFRVIDCETKRVELGDADNAAAVKSFRDAFAALVRDHQVSLIAVKKRESVSSGTYGIEGDLYQVGLLLYQLLGGFLPYGEIAWLDEPARQKYSTIVDDFERSKYVDDILKEKITKGAIASLDSHSPLGSTRSFRKQFVRRST